MFYKKKKIKLISEIEMDFPDDWDDATISDWILRNSVHAGSIHTLSCGCDHIAKYPNNKLVHFQVELSNEISNKILDNSKITIE